MNLFKKTRWAVLNCVTGDFHVIGKLPFSLGAGEVADLDLGEGPEGVHCVIDAAKRGGVSLTRQQNAIELFVNGKASNFEELQPDEDHSLKIGSSFLALRGEKKIEAWQGDVDPATWLLYDSMTQTKEGPMALADLCRVAQENERHPESSVMPLGLTMGFYLQQLLDAFGTAEGASNLMDLVPASGGEGEDDDGTIFVNPLGVLEPVILSGSQTSDGEEAAAEGEGGASPPPLPDAAGDASREPGAAAGLEETAPALPDEGALTCPVCWLHFDEGDIMHIATHNSLRGDPILGEDALQRFYPTRFNDLGQALDAFGLPCTDIGCPHCRRRLPPGFVEMPQHIVSIIGDQSAGKSYFLSVLIKVLPNTLSRHFKVGFQDADPEGNAILNDMKNALFSARQPEEARLLKTQLDGAMYERLPRYGRTVALPKPFVFSLSDIESPSLPQALVFYDNAGEHFQPGRDSADSPGAQHVAHSSGNLFLFDPFNSPEFRERIAGHDDPQFEQPIMDQQDIILSEMRVRIQKLLHLMPGQRTEVPLAVIVGKCDAWMHLLGERPWHPVICEGTLDLKAVRHNSKKSRELLAEICPKIVTGAESISSRVMYFPVSSFGHAPVRIESGTYVPDPGRLKPILVDAPVLWMLSQIVPDLVPGRG